MSSTTRTVVLSKTSNTLLLFSSTVIYFIPVRTVIGTRSTVVSYIQLPGIFKRVLPLAGSHSLRVICLSRREYEGSTPYSTDELNAMHYGSDADRTKFLQDQGILIALFLDGLIRTLTLPERGGVTVAGWSLGNLFTIAMRASIGALPDDTKQRLKAYTRGFIIFGQSLGDHCWS